MSSFYLLWVILTKYALGNFNCITISSAFSGTNDNDQTYVECNLESYPTMVSCGWRANSDYEDRDAYDGSWMTNVNGVNRCYAQNGKKGEVLGQGVQARARCCDFRHIGDIDCIGDDFGPFVGNPQVLTSECGSTYNFLTGCTVQSDYRDFNGCFPGTNWPYAMTAGIDYNWAGNVATAVSGSDVGLYIHVHRRQQKKKKKKNIQIQIQLQDEPHAAHRPALIYIVY